jgi:hypothetical protein
MSLYNNTNTGPGDNLYNERPEHRLHGSNQPLPSAGAQGGATTVDYSPEVMERAPGDTWRDTAGAGANTGLPTHAQGQQWTSTGAGAGTGIGSGAGTGTGTGTANLGTDQADYVQHAQHPQPQFDPRT